MLTKQLHPFNVNVNVVSSSYNNLLFIFRSGLKEILLGVDNALKNHGNSEISLNVDNESNDEAVTLDIREHVFLAITSLKEKLGII